MGKWLWVALLVAGPAMADDFAGQSTADICVRRAMALITALPNNAEPMLSAEVARRGESCADPTYVEIAKARLDAIGWGRPAYVNAPVVEDDRPERATRIREAAQDVLRAQQAQRDRAWANQPKQTTCRPTMGDGVICTTN